MLSCELQLFHSDSMLSDKTLMQSVFRWPIESCVMSIFFLFCFDISVFNICLWPQKRKCPGERTSEKKMLSALFYNDPFRAVASLTVLGGQEFHFPHFSSNPDQFFFPSNFAHFLPHFGPPGGRLAHPGRPWLRYCLCMLICNPRKWTTPVVSHTRLRKILNNILSVESGFQLLSRFAHLKPPIRIHTPVI